MVTVIDNVMFAVHSMSTSFPSESDQAQKEEEEGEEGRRMGTYEDCCLVLKQCQ